MDRLFRSIERNIFEREEWERDEYEPHGLSTMRSKERTSETTVMQPPLFPDAFLSNSPSICDFLSATESENEDYSRGIHEEAFVSFFHDVLSSSGSFSLPGSESFIQTRPKSNPFYKSNSPRPNLRRNASFLSDWNSELDISDTQSLETSFSGSLDEKEVTTAYSAI